MGSSPALSNKERKQVLAGLVDQGAAIVREAKHGTLVALPDGTRLNVSSTSSDYRARFAMRADVRRAGFHWPLDPPEKENPVTREGPTTVVEDGVEYIFPPSVKASLERFPRMREQTYRQAEPFLKRKAEYGSFWTNELTEELTAADVPGYRSPNAANRQTLLTLWFAGFRVVEAKRNRNGHSYRWTRPKGKPWPTEFAQEVSILGLNAARAAKKAEVGTSSPKPVEPTVTEDDAELSLAVEQEQRAIRAERLAETRRLDLEKEKKDHAQTRRDLMLRLAAREQQVTKASEEIERLRSVLEEERLARKEAVSTWSEFDQTQAARREAGLVHDVKDLKARLRAAEDQANELRAAAATPPAVTPRVVAGGTSEWWPIEPAVGQTIEQLIEGAPMFGLEVRVQARRK